MIESLFDEVVSPSYSACVCIHLPCIIPNTIQIRESVNKCVVSLNGYGTSGASAAGAGGYGEGQGWRT